MTSDNELLGSNFPHEEITSGQYEHKVIRLKAFAAGNEETKLLLALGPYEGLPLLGSIVRDLRAIIISSGTPQVLAVFEAKQNDSGDIELKEGEIRGYVLKKPFTISDPTFFDSRKIKKRDLNISIGVSRLTDGVSIIISSPRKHRGRYSGTIFHINDVVCASNFPGHPTIDSPPMGYVENEENGFYPNPSRIDNGWADLISFFRNSIGILK